jgi:hypothetical protein
LSSLSGVTTSCTTVGSSLELGLAGHWPLRDAAKEAMMSEGTARRSETKDEQWDRPTVCAAVEAAGGHVEVDPAAAEEGGGVAGGKGDDVRARDDARARPLHRGLGGVDDLEAPEAGVVGRAELLRLRVGRRRVQEHGGVAALRVCIKHGRGRAWRQ